uniref:Uncharacterized protein n=1 Tax=Oryza punctata TaxID=4537 RepID=A0A0E0LAV8_ORYPU
PKPKPLCFAGNGHATIVPTPAEQNPATNPNRANCLRGPLRRRAAARHCRRPPPRELVTAPLRTASAQIEDGEAGAYAGYRGVSKDGSF